MTAIVLAALNARYQHCSFGLRYLLANLGPLRSQAQLMEFTINQPVLDLVDAIVQVQPRIVALGVYIWNVEEITQLVSILKRVAPEVLVVVGGPEVSFEWDDQPLREWADYLITGEADIEFARLCDEILTHGPPPRPAVRNAPLPDLQKLALPYELYTDADIAHRVIYVEASRGCPFTCEFCLSALDIPVRQFPLDSFLAALQSLLDRGARQFKFVDRTFNLNLRVSRTILEFFLARLQPGLFLHFELIPDRLPDPLRDLIRQFPPGTLQFEIGIQTFNEVVCEKISRRQDNALVEDNLHWLRTHTGVHLHTDLIVGLPGESCQSFADGFDRLVRLGPHEIQVGILKRLRGTPIIRHDCDEQMVYASHPPYEILQTRLISFAEMQKMRRFARFWDQVANSGNFIDSVCLLWSTNPARTSPFEEFRKFSEWVYQREQQTTGISLLRLVEHLFLYLTSELEVDAKLATRVIWNDYQRGGRSDKPACLRPYLEDSVTSAHTSAAGRLPKRQQRRLTPESAANPRSNPEDSTPLEGPLGGVSVDSPL